MNRNLDIGIKAAILIIIGVAVLFTQQRGESTGQSPSTPIARVKNNAIKLEVASTKAEIEYGLMNRTSLPDDQGMVFLFHPAAHVTFWMYHTLIPLDMIFIKDGKIVKICSNVPPCRSENPQDCPQYPDRKGLDVTEVIEVNAGYAHKHNIEDGDTVFFELPGVGR